MVTARQLSERKGRRAEIITIWLYRVMGWRLMKYRTKTPFGEIDIVMQKKMRLKFIEVKYRSFRPLKKFYAEMETILPSATQQKRLKRSIHYFSEKFIENSNVNNNLFSVESDIILWNGWFYFDIQKDVMETETAF
ncbi:YraN family protein [Alphaproteobacteria bacterium]|jgi:Holliday junction resolvase-like predicted endonuclease|nr:hypothetical protein [Alphaproteobacteria bacterium]MDA9190208.1 YraN family protein [Alphaproteobacteria bacterium]